MRFYKQPHAFYAGIDLHARSMFTHIPDHAGATVFERDLPANPDAFLNAIAPYRAGLVVGVECMFAWYWLPATARYFSEIERAVLLGLHVARRGFWDAAFPNTPWRERGDNAVGSWEHESA